MIQAVIWKEWRQQRWKLAFGCVLLVFFLGTLASAQLTTSRELVIAVMIFGGMLLALYSAMGAFATEVSEGTVEFLAARPVRPGWVFLTKWFFGWLNFTVPLVLCCVFLWLRRTPVTTHGVLREDELRTGALSAFMLTTMFYTLTCCLSRRRASEAEVGLTGLVILGVLMIHLFLCLVAFADAMQHRDPLNVFRITFAFINPLLHLFRHLLVGTPDELKTWFVVEQAVVFALVMVWGSRRWQRSV
jgi:ABC-type transport system involved in multi-copper enzyme maturation permease subunit